MGEPHSGRDRPSALLLAAIVLAAALAGAGLMAWQRQAALATVDDAVRAAASPPGLTGPALPAPPVRTAPPVADLVAGLEARLQRQPDDAEGWRLLGRSYRYLGREAEAVEALRRAEALAAGAAAAPAAVVAGRIRGVLRLPAELADRVAPGDTVFVFARAPDGPAMPIAARRLTAAGGFPLPFELAEADALVPGRGLSTQGEVLLGARISRSGDAMPQPDDLRTPLLRVSVGAAEPVALTFQPGG